MGEPDIKFEALHPGLKRRKSATDTMSQTLNAYLKSKKTESNLNDFKKDQQNLH